MATRNNGARASEEFITSKLETLNALHEKMNAQVTCEIVVITSEMAKEWLKKNVMNRKLDNGRRNSYIRQLIDDVWQFNGQTIIFSDTDKLLDGQGRLTAVAESGVPMLALVVKGVPEGAFSTIDMGKTRTFGDTLSASQIMGETSPTHQSYTASIVKKVMEWKNGRKGSHGGCMTRTTSNNDECLEDASEHLNSYTTAALKAMNLCKGKGKENFMSNGKFYGCVMAYLNMVCGWSFEEVYPFFEELVDEYATRTAGKPTTTLRSYLRDRKEGKKKISDKEMYHMFARAWNAYINKEEVKAFSLKKSEEEFITKEEYELKNEKNKKIAVHDELIYALASAE